MSYTNSLAVSGQGATISINTGTVMTPVWTPVGEITDLGLSGRKNQTADVTNLQSSAAEFIQTIPQPGSYAVKGNYVATDAGQLAIDAQFYATGAAAKKQYKVQMPLAGTYTTTGDSYVFIAIVEEWNPQETVSPAKALTFSATLKISGSITKTAGS